MNLASIIYTTLKLAHTGEFFNKLITKHHTIQNECQVDRLNDIPATRFCDHNTPDVSLVYKHGSEHIIRTLSDAPNSATKLNNAQKAAMIHILAVHCSTPNSWSSENLLTFLAKVLQSKASSDPFSKQQPIKQTAMIIHDMITNQKKHAKKSSRSKFLKLLSDIILNDFITQSIKIVQNNIKLSHDKQDETNSAAASEIPNALIDCIKKLAEIPLCVLIRLFEKNSLEQITSFEPIEIAQWELAIENNSEHFEEVNALSHIFFSIIKIVSSQSKHYTKPWETTTNILTRIEKESPIKLDQKQDWFGLVTRIIKVDNIPATLKYIIKKVEPSTAKKWNEWLPKEKPLRTSIKPIIAYLIESIIDTYKETKHLQNQDTYCELAKDLDESFPIASLLTPQSTPDSNTMQAPDSQMTKWLEIVQTLKWSDIFALATSHKFLSITASTDLIQQLCNNLHITEKDGLLTISYPLSLENINNIINDLDKICPALAKDLSTEQMEKLIKLYLKESGKESSLGTNFVTSLQKSPYVLQVILQVIKTISSTINLIPSNLNPHGLTHKQQPSITSKFQSIFSACWGLNKTFADNVDEVIEFGKNITPVLIAPANTLPPYMTNLILGCPIIALLYQGARGYYLPEILLGISLASHAALTNKLRFLSPARVAPLAYTLYYHRMIIRTILDIGRFFGIYALLNHATQKPSMYMTARIPATWPIAPLLVVMTQTAEYSIYHTAMHYLLSPQSYDMMLSASGFVHAYLHVGFLNAQQEKRNAINATIRQKNYHTQVAETGENPGCFAIDYQLTGCTPSLTFATKATIDAITKNREAENAQAPITDNLHPHV